MHAGAESPAPEPLLPDAITVATRNARNWSMTAFRASESHGVEKSPPPRLTLTEATLEDPAHPVRTLETEDSDPT